MTTVAPPERMADVRVDGREGQGAVRAPADLLGLSVEWSMVEPWFGASAASASPVAASVLQTLQRDRATAGVLRVGGNSQDGYRWDPDGSTAANTLFTGTITPGMVDALLEVARRTGWRLLLGLNLKADDPARAAAMARYVAAADPGGRLLGFEVGNEPNAYLGTDVAGYVARFRTYAEAIAAAVPGAPLAGPAISHAADLGYLQALRDAAPPGLALSTWHHYANRPTRGGLLSTATENEWTQRVRTASAAAGGSARMGEGNSVGTGGLDGVSNVLASASWVVVSVLAGAAAGLAGYCLHSWDGRPSPAEGRTCWYTPFVVRQGVASARPPYYGLALLRHVPGRTFRNTWTTVRSAGGAVSSWALADPRSGRLYVYLVERSGTGRRGIVRVTVPAGLTGPAYLSRVSDLGGCGGKTTGVNGTRLAADGTLAWSGRPVRPVPGSSTQYDVLLGSCESALLSVGPP